MKKMNRKYKPDNSFMERYDDRVWSKNKEKSTYEEESTDKEESTDQEKFTDKKESPDKEESTDLSDMPSLEGDKEEVKEGKGLKILTPKKLLDSLPILLAQTKAENNSNKLKNESSQILRLLYQHNKITKKVYNNLIKPL